MTTYKRKRGAYSTKAPKSAFARKVARARASTASAMVVPGYTRTAGYYGRLSGPGSEQKFLDVAISDVSISTAGDIQNADTLVVIPQGAGESERVGRKVTLKKFMFRGAVFHIGATAVTAAQAINANRVRVIFYVDKQCNGATAAATDILASAAIESFNNLANRDRFMILKDKIYSFNRDSISHNGTNYDAPAAEVKIFMSKKCNIPLEYSGATGGITEIKSNNVGCLLIAQGNGTGNVTACIGTCRFRYTDM